MDISKTVILRPLISSLIIASALVTLPAAAGWFADNLVDPMDGKMDASKYLAEKKGVLPVPIIITEPAVGYGLGVAAVFLHDPLAGKTEPGTEFEPNPDSDGKLKPPSASALFGGYTENDTWFAGGAHRGIWKDDTMRYTGALVEANVNMKFYGIGDLGSNPVEFNTRATYFLQELLFRIKESDFLAGLNYTYLTTKNTFDTSSLLPGPERPDVKFDSISAGLGLVLQYESLDNTITPGQGLKAQVNLTDYGDTWGGDADFNKYRIFANYWVPVSTDWVLGFRADANAISGDEAPFYEYPYIDMRGIPAMRYQGEETFVGEVEVRWDFTPRWSAIGFVGAGTAKSDRGNAEDESVVSKGIGFRYLMARRFGMRAGIDVAWGPEDVAWYIQIGNAW
jgi:hypothetical protein